MTNYSSANSPEAVKQGVLAAIEVIHGWGISLADKAIALTILAEIATQMAVAPEAMTRTWAKYVNEWGE